MTHLERDFQYQFEVLDSSSRRPLYQKTIKYGGAAVEVVIDVSKVQRVVIRNRLVNPEVGFNEGSHFTIGKMVLS